MRHPGKRKELERRRRRGARLLAAGHSQAEVARQQGVSRQTVVRWERLRQQGGLAALRPARVNVVVGAPGDRRRVDGESPLQ
jgi:transposase